jgi:hypothetical protein
MLVKCDNFQSSSVMITVFNDTMVAYRRLEALRRVRIRVRWISSGAREDVGGQG